MPLGQVQCASTWSGVSMPRTSRTNAAAAAPGQTFSIESPSRRASVGPFRGAGAQGSDVAPRSHASSDRSGPPRGVALKRGFFFVPALGGGADGSSGGATRESSISRASACFGSVSRGAKSSSVFTKSARRSSFTS